MFFEIAIGTIALLNYIDARYNQGPGAPPLQTYTLPRVDEGTILSIVYGRCRVRAPVVVWSGNYVTPEDPGGVYAGSILFAVGVPFSEGRADLMINGLWYGDIKYGLLVTPGGSGTPPGTFDFAASISGSILVGAHFNGEFFDGSPNQDVSGATETKSSMTTAGVDATLIPGYKRVILLSCVNFITGDSASVGAISVEVRSLSTGSASDLGVAGWSSSDDADPAAVVYDLMVSPWGRAALSTVKVDTASFAAASATLLAEGHGYSRSIESADDALTLIGDVLRQIDGVAYEEPTTGKIELHLIRANYVVGSLADINPGNARLIEYVVQGQSETFNQVRVIYPDRTQNYSDTVAISQNWSNIVNQGGRLRSTDVRFVGCTTATLAQKLAARECAAVSLPQVKLTVEVNRSFYQARPGGVYTFTWPELGISGMVMRVVTANLGQLQAGKITLNLMRDIYDQTLGAFPVP